ncbi:cupin domain-containing protein [Caenimonas koreensis DSM 17982]|uniref:Cupin domain-containing protein n=1 Tax=Caenimonas koreensis DSM 17982 TaxID=1121255 RepID=A0A844BBH9_9BURK|nr:cupin domain-containing protein [Caenimonas koreensis]MRD48949.1 cupin domain-containing protein [Caenimonas koreensis DSM 17982]
MDTSEPLALLGGLAPAQFMKRHWQKKPLLVRGAIAGFTPPIARNELFALAARDDVESRLIAQVKGKWSVRHGPFARRGLPPLSRREWTLLVQGVDQLDERGYGLLRQFSFVPHARLDDLMVSYASDGGGVGPHFDSYDVFLLQAQGRRRWRIGRQSDLQLRDDVPLKVLANFEPEEEYVLEPGDMLYLPPRYAHDGVAQGECQTYSIGFRSPARGELARELLQRISEDAADAAGEAIYADPRQEATHAPGHIPAHLLNFAADAMRRALADPLLVERVLGEYLTEPKASVWFDPGEEDAAGRMMQGIELDRRTRMMYDSRHVFINGDSYRASGRDAKLMHALADKRSLSAKELASASADAHGLLRSWCDAGWAHSIT